MFFNLRNLCILLLSLFYCCQHPIHVYTIEKREINSFITSDSIDQNIINYFKNNPYEKSGWDRGIVIRKKLTTNLKYHILSFVIVTSKNKIKSYRAISNNAIYFQDNMPIGCDIFIISGRSLCDKYSIKINKKETIILKYKTESKRCLLGYEK